MEVSRYEADIRRPMRRGDSHTTVPRGWAVGILILLVVVSVVAFAIGAWNERYHSRQTTKASYLVRHDSMTGVSTYDGDMIRVYVITDPDTQVQYLVSDHGGMCLREDR